MKFNLVRIVPDNGFYIHAQVFHEIEAAVFFALSDLGYDVTNSINEFSKDRRNIVFGMHHCPVDVVRHDIPKDTIIYSLEQMKDSPECVRWCRKYRNLEVWDYSMRNTEVLKQAGVENIKHLKLDMFLRFRTFKEMFLKNEILISLLTCHLLPGELKLWSNLNEIQISTLSMFKASMVMREMI